MQYPPFRPPPPPGRPAFYYSLLNLKDARDALTRPMLSKEQVQDAINSAQFFIELAKKNL